MGRPILRLHPRGEVNIRPLTPLAPPQITKFRTAVPIMQGQKFTRVKSLDVQRHKYGNPFMYSNVKLIELVNNIDSITPNILTPPYAHVR